MIAALPLLATETFPALAVRLYDAVLAPGRWPGVMDALAEAAGAAGALLITQADESPAVLAASSRFAGVAASPEDRASLLPPATVLAACWAEGAPLPRPANEPPLSAAATRRFGVGARRLAALPDPAATAETPPAAGLFLCLYDVTPARGTDDAALQGLLPHLARAAALALAATTLLRGERPLRAALDRLPGAVVLVSGQGRILAANRTARALMDQGEALTRTADDHLVCAVTIAECALAPMIEAATRPGGGTDSLGRIPRFSGQGAPYLVTVTPLLAAAPLNGPEDAAALVLVIDPADRIMPAIDGLAAVYRLTPAEAEVCRLVVAGLSNNEIARRREVAPDTIKTQVRTILHKTQSQRRAELIRLAITLSLPALTPAH